MKALDGKKRWCGVLDKKKKGRKTAVWKRKVLADVEPSAAAEAERRRLGVGKDCFSS